MAEIIERIRHYILCILFHTLFPLLPIIFEKWIAGSISSMSLLISAAIYSIMIGNESKDKLIFGVSIFASIILAVAFGAAARGKIGANDNQQFLYEQPVYSEEFALFSISCFFLVSILERFRTHIIDGERYWKH